MLVLQGTTPEEVRQSIIELAKQEAERYRQESTHERLKIDKTRDLARSSVLLSFADMLDPDHCNLADLHKPSQELCKENG